MPSNYKKEMQEGKRDERGVKIQGYRQYKEGKDYLPATGDEMDAMYQMAKNNMQRQKERRVRAGRTGIRYETVEDLENGIIEYWNYLMEANAKKIALLPDLEGMCAFLGITRNTLLEWERNDVRGFASTIEQAKNDIAACKKQIGLHGKIPPIIMAMDFNNNHGYTQRQEVIVTPNNPLGDAVSNEELLARYDAYAELAEPTDIPVALPEGVKVDKE